LTGGPGRIVNITSVVGKFAPPFVGDYTISKHGLEAFSESLRRELMIYGIDVIAIGPGAVLTPIWDKAEKSDDTAYAKTDYAAALKTFKDYFIADGRKGLPPERISEAIHRALTAPKPRVGYAIVPNRLVNWTIPACCPNASSTGSSPSGSG